jgi:tetratricopeptide (TPR) repeat protein
MASVVRFAGALLLLPLIAAAWFSVRLARADLEFRRGTPEAVAHAVELAPANTEYTLLRAMQLEYDGADSTALLERAANLNPMNAAPRIRLGLAAEIRGDPGSAEKWLLDAARVDREFEPRWTLANFYFRRGNTEQFWKWIRAALDVSYGDRRPAFELCWNVSSDGGEIFSRAIPDRPQVIRAYLEYLNETRRWAAIPSAALKLASINDAQDRPVLFGAVDALIAIDDAASAKSVWQALGLANRSGVFRGDFEAPEVGAGFDWHFLSGQGITHLAIDQPQSLHRIALNGSQRETAELLRQTLSLEPHARYKLTWESRTQGIGSPTGIAWRIGDRLAPIAANENATAGEIEFVAPSDLAPLVLIYSRPPGEIRAEGSIELWHVAIARN